MGFRSEVKNSRLGAAGSLAAAPASGLAASESESASAGEQGFMLLGLIVVMAILLMALGVAASKEAFTLRREREVESARRADQYLRAIRRFYLKNQHYPGSIEQLENTNNVRYLRQRYVDPLSGKDYRLIPVGQNKTSVKGFFGLPLGGIASTGLGSVGGVQSTGAGGPAAPGGGGGANGSTGPGVANTGGANTGGAGSGGTSSGLDTSNFGRSGGFAGGPGGAGANGASTFSSGSSGSSQSGSGSGGSGSAGPGVPGLPGSPGSVGPFMGVGSSATGPSILVVNEQATYDTWEFLYDPRLESLRAATALNGGASSVGAGSLGSTPGGFGSTPGGFGSTPGTPPPGGTAPPASTPPSKNP